MPSYNWTDENAIVLQCVYIVVTARIRTNKHDDFTITRCAQVTCCSDAILQVTYVISSESRFKHKRIGCSLQYTVCQGLKDYTRKCERMLIFYCFTRAARFAFPLQKKYTLSTQLNNLGYKWRNKLTFSAAVIIKRVGAHISMLKKVDKTYLCLSAAACGWDVPHDASSTC